MKRVHDVMCACWSQHLVDLVLVHKHHGKRLRNVASPCLGQQGWNWCMNS